MTKLRSVISIVLSLSAIFALCSVGYFFIHLSRTADALANTPESANRTLESISATSAKLYDTTTQLNDTIALANKRLFADGGLIQATQKSIVAYKSVAVEAAIGEKKYWNELETGTTEVLGNANKALQGLTTAEVGVTADFHESTAHLNAAVDRIGLMVDQGGKTLRTAQGAIEAIDVPAVNESLRNASLATGNVAVATGDIKDAVHRWTRPASVLKSLAINLLGLAGSARAFF